MGDENNTDVDTDDTADNADTTSTDESSNSIVLTDDKSADSSTDNNSDEGDSSSSDDAAAGKKDDSDDAGSEGSQEPPDTYADFVMPEGMTLNETALDEALPLFKDLGLTQEQAQSVVGLYAKQVQAGSQAQIDNFNQQMTDWREQSQKDSEFGGDKFDENVKVAQSAVNAYGTPELKQLLEDHGVGNHPEFIRFMYRVGKTLGEDVPGSIGLNAPPAKDRVSILYPNENKE